MADNVINVKHRLRHDTEANWNSKNPVLLDGELGFITGSLKYKIGDGTKKWSELAFHNALTDAEKTKLSGIADGANKTTVDSALSSTSTNPVQNKVVNSALAGKSNTNHTHNYYIPLSGGTLGSGAKFDFPDSGNWSNSNKDVTFPVYRGGFSWSGQSDGIQLYAEETANDNLELVLKFTDDNSNGLTIKNSTGTSVSRLDANGNFTGNTTWDKITGKPSSYTPSSHTHDDRYYTESEINTKLATKSDTSHTHDDRYYTESEMNTKLSGKSDTTHTHNLSTMINTLTEGTSTPVDNDYYVSQYSGGGTTTTTYHRRPMKALFEYIKGKLSTVAVSGSYNDLSNKPTIPSVGNGTVTIKQGGTSKGTFSMNQSGNTTIELTDNNTWRGIQDNLTSTATDQSLSAAKGKWLNENKAAMTVLSSENLNNVTTPGFYSAGGGNSVTNKPSEVEHFGMIVIHRAGGSYYVQILFTDATSYRRFCVNGTWGNWKEDKLTDTVYTHPSYTAKSNGLYKVTVDATGHVSGTTAVSKSDITALGIPSTNTTYSTGTASALGLTKLYTGTGTATDGTMTQAAIKSALDGKSGTGHTHTSVNDVNDGAATTFAYSKDAVAYGNYTYLAAWNGKELRAVNKTQFATSGHNHDSTYLKLSGGTVTGVTSFTNTTASTSKTTGAVKVSGGMGVAGRMSANEVMIGDGCTLKYDSANSCVNFVFS